jgi:hypothetical protein
VTFAAGVSSRGPVIPRAYTLTHSDSTGELFLGIGSTFDRHQIAGWYTRLMRDEVLAEWVVQGGEAEPGDAEGADAEGRRAAGKRSRKRGERPSGETSVDAAASPDPLLLVHCHVSGGLIVGTAGWRYGIFQRHMPLVLESFRHGDRELFEELPHLDDARVTVRFHSRAARYDLTEEWGPFSRYRS